MTETGAAMGLAIGVAAIFVFMVLASQFESLLHPFTLLMSVPLAMVGAFVGLFIAGKLWTRFNPDSGSLEEAVGADK